MVGQILTSMPFVQFYFLNFACFTLYVCTCIPGSESSLDNTGLWTVDIQILNQFHYLVVSFFLSVSVRLSLFAHSHVSIVS